MDIIIISVYLISMTLIMIFSLVQFDLSLRYIRKKKDGIQPVSIADPLKEYPFVTIQLPIYNEKYVVERLMQSISGLDYPKNKFEIQVLDDSTDETSAILRNSIDNLKKKHFEISYLHRDNRIGYKAGALQDGLQTARGEFIAIFDADFIPQKDFLLKTIPFFKDNQIGMIQTRWGHINENYSLLTKLQAFGLNAHFSVEQVGRSSAGSFINFNGTAGIWRKKCIVESGGWDMNILSEDLDLSYRAQLKGWKFAYLEDVVAPAELPIVLPAIRSQQFRWTKGGAETARKSLLNVIKTKLHWRNKIHAIFHLLNSTVFPLLLLAAVTSIPMLLIKEANPDYKIFFDLGSVFIIGFFGISIFYWVAARYNHPQKTIRYYLINFPLFLIFCMGLSLQNTLAFIEGLIGIKTPFIRTPKFNVISHKDSLKDKMYVKTKISWQNVVEFLLFLYFLSGVGIGIYLGDFGLVLFHLMLAFGFAGVSYYTIKAGVVHA